MTAKRFLVGAIVVAAYTALVAGIAQTQSAQGWIASTKRDIRIALGLPKIWLPYADPGDAKGRTPLPCPKPEDVVVMVTGGQSNAANTNSGAQLTSAEGVYSFFDGQCFQTQDPVLGATNPDASLWPLLGSRLKENGAKDILFIHGAVGGSQASDWLDQRSNYYDTLMQRVKAARSQGYEVDLILWHQGETDAAVFTNAEDMGASFTALTGQLLADMPEAQMYLFQTSRCMGKRRKFGFPWAIEALKAVAQENPRIVEGMNTDELGFDYRHDACHFNSLGRERIVEQLSGDVERLIASR